jgi:hypothetical protein
MYPRIRSPLTPAQREMMAALEKEGWLPWTPSRTRCFWSLHRRRLVEFGSALDHRGDLDKSRPGIYLRDRSLTREQHVAMLIAGLPADCQDLI